MRGFNFGKGGFSNKSQFLFNQMFEPQKGLNKHFLSPIFHLDNKEALMIGCMICSGIGTSWVQYPVWQHTFVSPSPFSRRAVVNYWRKYVHEVLVNRLGGLSLPRKSVVRLTDRPDMTLDVCRGRKTTIQEQGIGTPESN